MTRIKGLSLFSNVGVAEAYLESIGVDIVVANELVKERAEFYQHLYPKTEMICGDITSDEIRAKIVEKSISKGVDFILATPPCQGMSRHGKRDPNDERNYLIIYAVDVIKKIKPKFILLENVTKILVTKITVNDITMHIPDYLIQELGNDYIIYDDNIFNAEDYGVPQSRSRCIIRMVRKDLKIIWARPEIQEKITLKDAIGHLPSLDPLIREKNMRDFFPEYEIKKEQGLKVSKWHYPPTHSWNHVLWMTNTPSGKTAFYNDVYYPQKKDGTRIIGRLSCYRRYSWDKPANTITQNNGVISSACCVHPGREIKTPDGKTLYSDARVLTIYELLIVTSLPTDWNIPDWADERLIRNVIGEGIPPLMIKAIVSKLINEISKGV
ncbi:DNA cytosine methyltransferase [Acholeplasma equifetale]|uniref:DNA cytosine methyltransferase n=1 Tax=Acholeplasma equifetale TaxID=264634 RepID=UPI00055266D9|nr:DNA cytosine methyltransferase [Acholeplasma equifetale]